MDDTRWKSNIESLGGDAELPDVGPLRPKRNDKDGPVVLESMCRPENYVSTSRRERLRASTTVVNSKETPKECRPEHYPKTWLKATRTDSVKGTSQVLEGSHANARANGPDGGREQPCSHTVLRAAGSVAPLHHNRNAYCLVSHSTGIAKAAAPSASPIESFVTALAIHRHLGICLDGIAVTESMVLTDLAFMCFAAAYCQLCSEECSSFVPNKPSSRRHGITHPTYQHYTMGSNGTLRAGCTCKGGPNNALNAPQPCLHIQHKRVCSSATWAPAV